MVTEYWPEQIFGYRWVPGTAQIFNDADPCSTHQLVAALTLRSDKSSEGKTGGKRSWALCRTFKARWRQKVEETHANMVLI